jgi:hypothetical protein
MIGEPDAGKPHVRFDEGVQETCDIAARLCPTLRQARFCAQLRDAAPFRSSYSRARAAVTMDMLEGAWLGSETSVSS